MNSKSILYVICGLILFLSGCAGRSGVSAPLEQPEASDARPGGGMNVGPAIARAENLPSGERVNLSDYAKGGITIRNRDTQKHSYTLTVKTVKETNNRLSSGYEDIPDPAWFEVEKTPFEVPGGGSREVDIGILIPEEYAGKRFQGVIEVRREKSAPQDMFVLAAQVYLYIDTAETAE